MLTKKELDEIRQRHHEKEVIYTPEGDVAGVVVYDVNPRATTGPVDVSVEKKQRRDDDVRGLLNMVGEMQRMLTKMVQVSVAIGPNEYGMYPLTIDTTVLCKLKELAGYESEG